MPGSRQQGGERLIARQTLSLLPISRPDPTNTNPDSGSPTLPLSTSLISPTGSGASSSTGSSGTSSSVPSASLGRPTSSPPIPIPSSSSSSSSFATSSSPSGSTSTTPVTSSPSSFSPSHSASSTSLAPTTSNVMSSTAETSSSASTSPTVVAGSHVKTGAVVGGVVGGVVFVLLLIAGLLLYLRIRRQIPSRSRRRSMGEFDSGAPAGQWAGLSSRDNTFEAVAVPPRSHQRSGSRSYPQADSMGMIAAPTDSSAGHGKYSLSSSEETTTSEAQRPRAGRRRSEYIETVPPLEYAPQANSPDRRARKQSNGSSTRAVALAKLNTAAANNSTATTATTASGHSRQRSADRSAYAGANSNPSTPTAAKYSRGTPASPTSPTSPSGPYSAEPMSRSTSTSVGGVRRNPTRKPVPSYHSSASAASTEKRQSTPSTPAQSLTPAQSREDLNHKSSFGNDRPVHYLVPDLPPSGRK